MRIESLTVGPFAVNAYILADESTNEAIVVDPGADAERLLARVEALGSSLRAVVATHGHLAHVYAAHSFLDAASSRTEAPSSNVPFCLHADDAEILARLPERALVFGLPPTSPPRIDHELADGTKLEVGDAVVEVLPTPGHSPGSVCLWIPSERAILTGDVLFSGSIGRTDIDGSSSSRLLESIRERVFPLGDDVTVYPGHGSKTTVGDERETNPFLSGQLLGGDA